MSYPTVLSPWFVVQRNASEEKPSAPEYYTNANEGAEDQFTAVKRDAMLFVNLAAAARVASTNVAIIRVLTSKDDLKEFGR